MKTTINKNFNIFNFETLREERKEVKPGSTGTAFSRLCWAEKAKQTAAANAKLKEKGHYYNPLYIEDDSQHRIVAAAQRAATKWFGPTASDCYDRYISLKTAERIGKEYWLLPVIEGHTAGETLKQLAALCRSIFIHKSTTYDLAMEAISNTRKRKVTREDAATMVEWFRVMGLLEPENDKNRTHLTKGVNELGEVVENEVVQSQPTAVLSQAGLALLERCKLEEMHLHPSKFVPVITAENAVRTSHAGKEGTSVSRSKHVKSFSIPGETCVESLNAFASVALQMHPDAMLGVDAYYMRQCAKEEKEVGHYLADSEPQIKLLQKQHARLWRELQNVGSEAFYVSKAFDYRGRIYDASGELSFQALKGARGLFGFADAMPVNEYEINIQKGRMYFDSIGDKVKHSDEYAAECGAAWNGRNPDGSPCLDAAMLFTDPARAFCALDANQQGYQMLGICFGDKSLLTYTNVIGDKRHDLYGKVANLLGLPNRNHAKVWMIPYVYGAGIDALVRDYNKEYGKDAVSKETMKTWVEKFEKTFSGAKRLKEFLRARYAEVARLDEVSAENDRWNEANCPATLSWTLPDGFKVEYSTHEVINLLVSGGELQDFKMKLHSTWRRDFSAMVTALAPNLVHSLDGYMLREVQRRCGFPIVPVHDSYSCHSHNVPVMRQVIIEVMQEIADKNILGNLVEQLILKPAKETTGFFGAKSQEVKMSPLGNTPIDKNMVTNPYMFM